MAVPWVLQAVVLYTVGGMVLMPIQAAFLIYDTAKFLRKAARYTSKGIFYAQRWHANRRAKKFNVPREAGPVPVEGAWVILDAKNTSDGGNSAEKSPPAPRVVHIQMRRRESAAEGKPTTTATA
jgi:hypothetical protein